MFYQPRTELGAYDNLYMNMELERLFGSPVNELTLFPNPSDETQVEEWVESTHVHLLHNAFKRFYMVPFGALHGSQMIAHQLYESLKRNKLCTGGLVFGSADYTMEFLPEGYSLYSITPSDLSDVYEEKLSNGGRFSMNSTYDPRFPSCKSTNDLCKTIYTYLQSIKLADYTPMRKEWDLLQDILTVIVGEEKEDDTQHRMHAEDLQFLFVCWDTPSTLTDHEEQVPPIARLLRHSEATKLHRRDVVEEMKDE